MILLTNIIHSQRLVYIRTYKIYILFLYILDIMVGNMIVQVSKIGIKQVINKISSF